MRRGVPGIVLSAGVMALCLAIVVGLVGCGGGSSAGVACASSSAPICTNTTTVDGAATTVLTTRGGKTLYMYRPDTRTAAACTGGCALGWPPLTISSDVPSRIGGLSGSVGVLDGGNGRQVIYNGHPLYSYAGDLNAGDANGQGAEGGNWHVATPDAAPLGAPAATATPAANPTDTPGPYGY